MFNKLVERSKSFIRYLEAGYETLWVGLEPPVAEKPVARGAAGKNPPTQSRPD
jgi:hypothetical protein